VCASAPCGCACALLRSPVHPVPAWDPVSHTTARQAFRHCTSCHGVGAVAHRRHPGCGSPCLFWSGRWAPVGIEVLGALHRVSHCLRAPAVGFCSSWLCMASQCRVRPPPLRETQKHKSLEVMMWTARIRGTCSSHCQQRVSSGTSRDGRGALLSCRHSCWGTVLAEWTAAWVLSAHVTCVRGCEQWLMLWVAHLTDLCIICVFEFVRWQQPPGV
jgi:hypothetical protein